MKSELVKKLEELLQTEELASIKQDVRNVRAEYNALTTKDRQDQEAAWNELEHEEGEMFEYQPAAEDEAFEALNATYSERIKELGRKIAEEQKNNLDAKKAILAEFEGLIKTEENVGKAFATLKELQDKWKTIGEVPGDQYKEVQDTYSRLHDEFYYNINIYKQLQDHDLKVNLKKKEELIALAAELHKEENIKEIEILARSYQKQWTEIGPSPRETYKELGDTFFGHVRAGYEKVQAHYDEIKSGLEANLNLKKALVDKVRQIAGLEITNHGTWTKKTEEILAIQKEWKEIGYGPKKENEEVWQEFRGICDQFFEKKNNYYNARKGDQKTNQSKKEALLVKANEWKDSTDWKKATESIIKIQEDWKAVGACAPAEERKLWQKFREACDHFFNAKKEHFAGMDDRQAENQKMKEALLAEIEAFQPSGSQNVDAAKLREFGQQWSAIGHVPRKVMKSIQDRYYAAIDTHYSTLKLERRERSVDAYKDRLENLKGGDSGDRQVKREKNLLREKIDRLKQHVLQYENNMSILTGPGADDLKKDIEKKIRSAQEEIEEIKQKLRLFNEI